MDEKSKKSDSKKLLVLLVCLCLVICGLVIGIVVANNDGRVEDNNTYAGNGTASQDALAVQEKINEKFESDLDYSLDDAVAEYEYEMTVGSNARKVYMAMGYADFIYEWYEDIDRAIEIMERAEPLLDNEQLTIDYYVAMRNFYDRSGNSEKAEEYNQKLIKIMPAAQNVEASATKEDSQ